MGLSTDPSTFAAFHLEPRQLAEGSTPAGVSVSRAVRTRDFVQRSASGKPGML